MLLIIIPITWLAILTLFVALCRAAARGDAPPAPRDRRLVAVAFETPVTHDRRAMGRHLRWRSAAEQRCSAWLAHARTLEVRHLAAHTAAPHSARSLRALPRRPA